ncbi:MAG: N-formylglutamate amidohydrolase [Methanoculleus sp.]
MSGRYPFLFSIPHGGVSVPPEVRGFVSLSRKDIAFNSDPHTRLLYGFDDVAEALVDFEVSRVFVDANRAPYEYPPRAQDGVVKMITQDGTPVYRKGFAPGRELIGVLLQSTTSRSITGWPTSSTPTRSRSPLTATACCPTPPRPGWMQAGRAPSSA